MKVTFSGALLRFVNFQKSLDLPAGTVAEALAGVAERFPAARSVIFDAAGQVRQVHQVFLNGKQLAPAELGTTVQEADRVDLLTAIAGG